MELSICAQCGRHIEPAQDKSGWRHVAGYRPRHIATPAREQTDPLADARARVLTGLRRNLMHSGYGHAGAQQRAEAILDAYAHELAQKLRTAIAGFDLDDHWAVYYPAEQVQALPDLIDPEAQQ